MASASSDGNLPPKEGRLVKWSGQKYTSEKKKVVFVHGWNLQDSPTGTGYESAETKFSLKIDNLEYLGDEKFKNSTSRLAEFWLYEYDACQNVSKIADDLARAIKQHPEFRESEVAIIGYSEGGVVLWELMQKHPDLIEGGICLGAPIMSTPLVHKEVRDAAVEKVFKHSGSLLIPKFDALAKGSEQLEFHREMPFQTQGNLYCFAGSISTARTKLALLLPWKLKHYIDILDVLISAGKNFFTGIQDNRQFAELLADIIEKSEWSIGHKWDKLSDGLVPVSSALAGATEQDERHKLWKDYDHFELLSGKGDLNLDRATLEILDKILNLMPRETVSDLELPPLPDRLEIFLNDICPLRLARFAYVKSADKKIHLIDANWQRDYVVPVDGDCSYPEFSPKKLGMTFTVNWQGHSNIYLFDEKQLCAIAPDHQSRCSSFSPNGKWLTYQSGNELVIYNLKSLKRHSLVSGIDLASPPIWVAEWLTGKVYFANQSEDGTINLYCASPRWRRIRNLAEVELVATNIGRPHLVRGWFGGVVATQSDMDASGKLVTQRVSLVSGLFTNHFYTFTIRLDSEAVQQQIIMDHRQIILDTNQALHVESIVFDRDYGHLYVVDTADTTIPSIYLFNLNSFLVDDDIRFEDWWKNLGQEGYQLSFNQLAK